MAASLAIKTGATFSLNCQLTNDDGTPVDLTNATLTCMVRDIVGSLVSTAVVTITAATQGQFTVLVADTSGWQAGQLRCDVRMSVGGTITFSDTLTITVSAPVTT